MSSDPTTKNPQSGLDRARNEAARVADMTPEQLADYLEPQQDPEQRAADETLAAAERKETRRRAN